MARGSHFSRWRRHVEKINLGRVPDIVRGQTESQFRQQRAEGARLRSQRLAAERSEDVRRK